MRPIGGLRPSVIASGGRVRVSVDGRAVTG